MLKALLAFLILLMLVATYFHTLYLSEVLGKYLDYITVKLKTMLFLIIVLFITLCSLILEEITR
jgi:hypothetical protein